MRDSVLFAILSAVCVATVHCKESNIATDKLQNPILLKPSFTNDIHAAGLRPMKHTANKSDPLLFKHRYHHHDTHANRLVYYEYEARRHAHVIMLDEMQVMSCFLQFDENDAKLTWLTLRIPANLSSNITAGSILVGSTSALGCQHSGEERNVLRERVLHQPTSLQSSVTGAKDLKMLTSVAGFHECFHHANAEFYSGRPELFELARAARVDSLLGNGHKVPNEGFASSVEVIRAAKARAKIESLSQDSTAPKNTMNRNVKEINTSKHRELSHSLCWLRATNDFQMTLFGTDCTSHTPGTTMDDDACFWRASSSGSTLALKVGNTYTLRWTSAASDPNVEIFVQESDGSWGSTHCADLDLSHWISNQAYSGNIANSPNSFSFTMPDLRSMSCSNDFLGGFPEFQFRIQTQSECHRGYWGEFVLLLKEDTGSQSYTMQVPPSFSLGSSTAGAQITCTNCQVTGTGDVHVLVRTSSYDPFDETWTWGSLSMTGSVDVTAQAWFSRAWNFPNTGVQSVFGLTCLPSLCFQGSIAGITFWLGILGDLSVYASAGFNAVATLSYQRSLQTSGTLALHTRQGSVLYTNINGFSPTAPQDAVNSPPTLRISIDANASFTLLPRLVAGIFASISTSASAEAYLMTSAHLRLTAWFNFRTALGTTNHFSPLDTSSFCTSALIGCTAQCASNSDTLLRFALSTWIYGYYKFYVQASFGSFGNAVLGDANEQTMTPSPMFNTYHPIGAWCYFLFPPSPPPPSPLPPPPPPPSPLPPPPPSPLPPPPPPPSPLPPSVLRSPPPPAASQATSQPPPTMQSTAPPSSLVNTAAAQTAGQGREAGLSTPLIVGIAVGCGVVACFVLVSLYFFCIHRKRKTPPALVKAQSTPTTVHVAAGAEMSSKI